jgi:hypothetical protein
MMLTSEWRWVLAGGTWNVYQSESVQETETTAD